MKKLIILLLILFVAMLYGQTMQGNYTVGGMDADFTDLDDAIAAMLEATDITGNVYFYLNPGTYTGPYIIENLDMQGYSLDISSGTYSGDEVVFTNHAATSQDNYIILIKNSNNIRIDDFDFAPTGQYSRSIVVSGDSNFLTISNNRFFNSGTGTSNNESIYFINDNGNDADDVLIQFNQFFDGSYHVQINSTNYTNNFRNFSIQANVHSGGYQGISLKRCSNVTLDSNTMNNVNSGIGLNSVTGSLVIKRNRLNVWASGLSVSAYSTSTTPVTPNIYNNIIRANGNNWYSGYSAVDATGLIISQSERIFVAHNSVELSSPSSGSYAAAIGGNGNIFRKNHFVNLGGGYSLNFFNTEPGVTNRNLVEYNNLYAAGTNLGKRSNVYYRDIDEMNVLFDSYNADFNPFFEDEYLRSSAPRLNNLGAYAGIAEDFFGNPRSNTTPDIGAHEYDIDIFDPLLAPMQGTYLIGTGRDYASVNAFARDLAFRGINNPITAYLCDNVYNEQVVFDRIPGSGHDREVVIQKWPHLGAGETVTISFSEQTALNNFVLKIRRSQYIEFYQVAFQTEATQNSNIMVLDGYVKNLELKNCSFIAPTGISGLGKASILADSNSGIMNLEIFGGSFSGNGIGASLYGSNIQILYNLFEANNQGILLTQTPNPVVEGNHFLNNGNLSISTNGSTAGRIYKNKIFGSQRGITVANGVQGDTRTLIANNLIRLVGSSANNGIWISGSWVNVLNNSVYLSGNSNGSAFYSYQLGSEIDIVNNVFVSMDGLAMDLGYYSLNPSNVIDYNNYYTQSNYLVKYQSLYDNIYHLRSETMMPEANNHSVRYNPLFDENMMVRSQYLRGIGSTRTEFEDDVDHQIREGAWDLGAQQQFGASDLSPLVGDYTVGSPTSDYPTLQEALDAIQYHGVVGHVYFNLQPGTYTGGYVIEDFPTEMDYPSQFLYINGNSLPPVVLDATSNVAQENYFFLINAARNVFFNYLDLSSEPAGRPVHFIRTKGRVDDIQIRYVNFELPTTNSSAIYTGSSLGDSFIVEYCNFTGGGNGIVLQGSYYDNNRFANVFVRHNQFTNTQNPINLTKVSSLQLHNNTMNGFNTALSLSSISGESSIYRNRMITPNSGSANQLVFMQNVQGTADAYIDIYQNIIYLKNHSSYLTAMNLNSMAYVNLLHNTIVAENNYFNDYGSALNLTSSNNMLIQNNVIAAPHRGYALTLNSNTDLVWMANAYYGAAPHLGKINGIDYPPLELYSQQLTDPLASFANPLIDDNGYCTSSYLRNRGIVSDLDTDIDGESWTGLPSVGANNIADGGIMFTSNQTIGTGGDFPDLPSALDALQSRGIDADVTFFMLNESFPTHYTFGYIPGTLGGYQFKLTADQGANATLHHNATANSDNYILMLKNLYNTTIEGLHFHTQNPTFGTAIALGSFNDQVLIRGNSFNTNAINPTSNNVSAIYGYSVQNRSLRVEDNTIHGLAYGVYLYGSINSAGYEIKGNSISNAHTGLYFNQLGAVDVFSNEISARDKGLHLGSINTARIRGNQMITSGGNYVVYHNSGTLTTGTQEIYNNYFRGVAMQDVIYLSRVQNAKIYHNTIINASSFAASRGLNHSGQNSGLDIRNNIVMANGGIAARYYNTADITALITNIYYSTSGVPVMLNNAPIADLTAYRSTFGDVSSMYTDPLLVPGSYTLLNDSPAIDAGVVILDITHDIDGRLRQLPDIGCAEYVLLVLDTPQNLQISRSGEMLMLSWDAVPGAEYYLVYSSTNPDSAAWTEQLVSENFIEINPSVPACFYRVKAGSY